MLPWKMRIVCTLLRHRNCFQICSIYSQHLLDLRYRPGKIGGRMALQSVHEIEARDLVIHA